MLISISPKYAVPQVVGYIKGKSEILMRGDMAVGNKNSRTRVFGPEVTTYPPQVVTKKLFVGTHKSRKN